MERISEKNMWGILLSWCFALSEEMVLAVGIALLTSWITYRHTPSFDIRRFLMKTTLFFLFQQLLCMAAQLSFPLYLLIISVNMAVLSEQFRFASDFSTKDWSTWILLTLGFSLCALFLPETVLVNEVRVRCFSLVIIIFMPNALLYTVQEMRMSQRLSQRIHKC